MYKKFLKENPDKVYIPNKDYYISWQNNGVPFYFYKGEFFLQDASDFHHSSYTYDNYDDNVNFSKLPQSKVDILLDFKNRNVMRNSFDYPGRFWPKEKIISFWEFPSNSKLKEILKLIEKEVKLFKKIPNIKFNNAWRIEVIESNKKVKDKYIDQWDPKWQKAKLIPLDKYNDGHAKKVHKDIDKGHELSPVLKKKKRVSKGWGSEKRPGGLSQTQRFQKKHTSENNISLYSLYMSLIKQYKLL